MNRLKKELLRLQGQVHKYEVMVGYLDNLLLYRHGLLEVCTSGTKELVIDDGEKDEIDGEEILVTIKQKMTQSDIIKITTEISTMNIIISFLSDIVLKTNQTPVINEVTK